MPGIRLRAARRARAATRTSPRRASGCARTRPASRARADRTAPTSPVCASRNVGTPDSAEMPAPVSAATERALRRRPISAAGMSELRGRTASSSMGDSRRDSSRRGPILDASGACATPCARDAVRRIGVFAAPRSVVRHGALPCPATRSARCSASPRSANRTARRSAASSTAARRAGARRAGHPARARPAQARHVAPRHAAARIRHGRDPVRRVRGPHDRHADRAPDPQRGPAQQGLREHRRDVPARPRRLRVLAEVRHSRLSRRRPRVGARDGGARRGGRHREEVARRAPRRRDSRPSRRSSARTSIPFEDWAHVDANPFFVANATIVPELEAFMDALRKSGDSCGAKIDGRRERRAGRLGRARLRPARRRPRAAR